MANPKAEAVVIGAGVVGCAVAERLTREGYGVIVLEAGPRIAEGITSRNSGVIHAGLYYPKGSLKAKTCLRGAELLYEWVEKKRVPYSRCGKLVVATGAAQLEGLEALQKNAEACNAPGVRMLTRQELQNLEPELVADAALFSEQTGIVDSTEYTRSLLFEAESRGATLVLNCTLIAVDTTGGGNSGYRLHTSRGPIEADVVVNCAGLAADNVARMVGVDRYRIYPCRGDYFSFRSDVKYRHLIYPVKDKASPGLGVHVTLDLAGRLRLGPDVEYVSRTDDFSAASGERKLESFRAAAERLLGLRVSVGQLQYDSCGIRPKLRAPGELEEKDFVISLDRPGWVNLVGIESPGLTGCMGIADSLIGLL